MEKLKKRIGAEVKFTIDNFKCKLLQVQTNSNSIGLYIGIYLKLKDNNNYPNQMKSFESVLRSKIYKVISNDIKFVRTKEMILDFDYTNNENINKLGTYFQFTSVDITLLLQDKVTIKDNSIQTEGNFILSNVIDIFKDNNNFIIQPSKHI